MRSAQRNQPAHAPALVDETGGIEVLDDEPWLSDDDAAERIQRELEETEGGAAQTAPAASNGGKAQASLMDPADALTDPDEVAHRAYMLEHNPREAERLVYQPERPKITRLWRPLPRRRRPFPARTRARSRGRRSRRVTRTSRTSGGGDPPDQPDDEPAAHEPRRSRCTHTAPSRAPVAPERLRAHRDSIEDA